MTPQGDPDDRSDPSLPYPPGPPGTPPSPSDRYFQDLTYSRAKNALLLGLTAFFCCGFVTGIPAIWVGLRARRDIAASGGRLRGRSTATAGIVLGALGCLAGAGLLTYQARQS